jgi:Ala-tRNA(Pro) deacylase
MDTLLRFLDDNQIAYQVFEHEPVLTVEQAEVFWSEIAGTHCKNLFFRDKRGKQHYLVITEKSKPVSIDALNALIGNNEKLSFASERRLTKYLNLAQGAVSPFGLINDAANHVIVLLDAELKNSEVINFHPNVNTATLSMSYDDFEKFLTLTGNAYRFVAI